VLIHPTTIWSLSSRGRFVRWRCDLSHCWESGHRGAVPTHDDTAAVMFDFMNPVGVDRRLRGFNRLSGTTKPAGIRLQMIGFGGSGLLAMPQYRPRAIGSIRLTGPRPLPKLLGIKSRHRMGRDAQLHPTRKADARRSGRVPSYGWDAGLRSITFERQATRLSDPDAADRLASLNLALCCCKSSADEVHLQAKRCRSLQSIPT
jgi:hypothetical protein